MRIEVEDEEHVDSYAEYERKLPFLQSKLSIDMANTCDQGLRLVSAILK